MRLSPLPLLSLSLLLACGDKEPEDTSAGTDDTSSSSGEEDVTFAGVQQTLSQSCAFSSCHGAGAGGLTLGDGGEHAALVGVESTVLAGAILVVPGDASQSYLIQKLEGAAGILGDPMPPSGALDAAIIADIRAWIDAGATED